MKKVFLDKSPEQIVHKLFGIVSSEKDYRMAWLFNEKFHAKFIQTADIEMIENELLISFSVFKNSKNDNSPVFLIKNKIGNTVLSKKNKIFDYFLVVISPFATEQDFLTATKVIPEIQLIQDIEPEKKIIETMVQILSNPEKY